MATTYISPTGSGDKSGSSWANAAPITSLDAMVKKAGTGGTVLLAADKGDYVVKSPISITGSGVTISGANADGSVGEAHFVGTRAANWTAGAATGNELFRINKGADNLVFQNMQIDNTGTAFRVGGDVKNLTVQHIDADNVQRFFEDYVSGSNKTATISGLTIRDVDVAGFSKNAIRLQYDTNNVLIEDVRADSERQDGDNFAMGVHLEDTVHDVTFRRVTMENATQTAGSGDYWNGDGFASERGTYNLTFEDTVARGNTDGGYDIKSDHVTFIRALAEDNARNFRVWGKDVKIIDSTGLDPHIRGGIGLQTQLWTKEGAEVTVINSTFADSGSKTKVIAADGAVSLVGTTIEQAATAATYAGTKPVGLATTVIEKVVATGLTSQGTTYSDGSAVKPVVTAPEVVVTVPAASAPVATTPVASTPAVSTPVASTPAASSPAAATPVASTTTLGTGAVDDARTSGDWLKIKMTTAAETLGGTALAEMFVIDQSKATGADVIKNFGSNDLLVFTQKLADSNGDGVVTFGKNGILNLGANSTLKVDGLDKGVRLLGQTADGYVYGSAAVWKAGATLPTATAKTAYASTAANESYVATNAHDTFFFDNSAGKKLGTDTITSFGKTDVIVTKVALKDGNGDGFIVPGKSGLDLGGGNLVGGLSLSGTGLRAMGSNADGFVYADGNVRPKNAIEGKLTVADTLSGGKTDTAKDVFFFDTALHQALGADKVVNFGAKDVIVTTSQIGNGAVGSHIDAVGGSFTLSDDGAAMGSVSVTGIGGQAVTSLEYDGTKFVDGVHYYVYSAVGSAVGVEALG